MLMVALLSSLTGAVLGLRFRVYALLPAFALASVMIGVSALADDGVMTAVWRTGTALIMLQAGYVAGIATRYVVAAARTQRQSSASLQPSSRRWPIHQGLQKALSGE